MRSDMLATERLKKLQDLVNASTREELIWINGYLTGLVSETGSSQSGTGSMKGSPATIASAVKKITMLYGTETGNSKRLATQLAAAGRQKGVQVRLKDLDQYRLADLKKEDYVGIVISTQGEGEPPLTARAFYAHIHQPGLRLGHLKFAVLALGDSAYPHFCKTGEDVFLKLKEAGADPLLPLQKCDVDYETDARQWFDNLVSSLEKQGKPPQEPAAAGKKQAGRRYYEGNILANINLNDKGSAKQTFHIEIGTPEPVEYEPGDALAIIPVNKKIIVDHIISSTGIDRNAFFETAKASGTVEQLLTSHLNICFLLGSAVKKYAAISGHEIPDVRMDLVDLLRIYPLKDAAQFAEILKILSPIAPRLYSISSSPTAHGKEELHLTVSRHSFRVKEEQRFGLCSEFLGELPPGTPVKFYIHKNRSFKMPPADADMIMIGPGTGVAPFRSFLAERDATGAKGRNWLFFGEQHFQTDFLYQTEIQGLVGTGVLQKVSLAFSRDQAEKIYVQHRMREEAEELYSWIASGAYLYISGTRDPMSVDVEQEMLRIIHEIGRKSKEVAKDFLDRMKKEGRFQKDVY